MTYIAIGKSRIGLVIEKGEDLGLLLYEFVERYDRDPIIILTDSEYEKGIERIGKAIEKLKKDGII